MRKLMIAMLALAVVFGFAACDNSNSGSTSLMDKYVVALEITEGPEAYFVGETLDKDQYTVVATQNDGQKVELASSDFKFEGTVPGTINGADNSKVKEAVIGKFVYTGIYQGTINAPSVDVKASVYKIDAVDVEGPASAKYYDSQDMDDFRYSDYTVTAYALDGATVLYSDTLDGEATTPEYTLDSSEVISGGNTTFATGNWTLNVQLNGADADPIDGGKASVSISVSHDEIASIALRAKEGAPKVVVGATRSTYDVNDLVEVVYTMVSGKTFVNTDGEDELPTAYGAATVAWSTNGDKIAASDKIKASVKVKGNEVNAPDYSIETIADYISKVTIVGDDTNAKVNGTTLQVKPDTDKLFKTSYVTATIAWASGNTPETDAETIANALQIVGSDDPKSFDCEGYTGNLPISFALNLTGVTADTEYSVKTITVVSDFT